MVAIDVRHLSMTFRAPVRQQGVRAAVRSLVQREYREIQAVQDVSFRIAAGEVVGFLGPNGAGKSTTMKILAGILHPTAGAVSVLGATPWQREAAYLRRIAMVRGSRAMSGPGELTVADALGFQKLIYAIPEGHYRRNLAELTAMLGLHEVLSRQVRALSLGERMRAGLAMALIYRPQVLFLDEPTIGLDVAAIAMVRAFIGEYAMQTGATVLLTSHAMADVEHLCRRIVLIDHGRIRYDGALSDLANALMPSKDITVQVPVGDTSDWRGFGDVLDVQEGRVRLRVARAAVPTTTARILAQVPVIDLSVTDPPLESVIAHAYREGVA